MGILFAGVILWIAADVLAPVVWQAHAAQPRRRHDPAPSRIRRPAVSGLSDESSRHRLEAVVVVVIIVIRLQAVPATFVGKAGDCGTAYPAGSRIVTSAWLGGMGLPDNGGQNVGSDPKDNPSKQDPHLGLLLSKNGTTADCSAAEAEITGVTGIEVTADFHLGF